MQVVIIDYGAGNLFSVQQAFNRLGVNTVLTSDPQEILSASHVVFPGVGHAESAMKQLKATQLDQLIPQLNQPVLGICLGMQLMCDFTEEGDVKGLGIFNTNVKAIQPTLPVPHMGWNDVIIGEKETPYYFVHSYAAEIGEETIGVCSYSKPFSAILQKGPFLGAQFHPEKSGEAGEEFLKQFLSMETDFLKKTI
jgi:glutamine amidotransferase